MDPTPVRLLPEYGQSAWVDAPAGDIARDGVLERLIRSHGVSGVVASQPASAPAEDWRRASELLLPIWEVSGGRDGYVSIGGHRPVQRSLLPANVLIEIPATDANLAGLEDLVAAGVSVNATSIFSAERHRQVVDAYVRGVERLVANGGDPAAVTSVASVVVARVDAEVDRRLEQIGGTTLALRGKLALANARLVYRQYREAFDGPRWAALAALGARPQRCLWTSVAPENRCYSDVLYAEELIGADTITALPPPTLAAFADHGIVADRLGRGIGDAQSVFEDVRDAGVDLEAVWQALEAAIAV